MRLSYDVPSRIARGMFAVLMGWAWAGALNHARAQPAAVSTTQPTAAEQAARVEHFSRSLRALEDGVRELPRDTFDLDAVVQQVGRDPTQLFEWVRDRTAWAPYSGSLRGTVGVLMDRLGNSLDRSLLLAALLKTAGHEVRLAHGQLPADQATQLLDRIRTIQQTNQRLVAAATPTTAPTTQPANDAIKGSISKYGLDETGVRNGLKSLQLQFQRLQEAMAERLTAQTPALAKLLNLNGDADAKAAIDANRAAAVQSLRDHWWVQRQDGDRWIDLDPLLPDAKPGASLIAAADTTAVEKLPPELSHQVELRVVLERRDGAQVSESVVLRHVLRPSELIGKTVAVGNIPLTWPGDLKLAGDAQGMSKLRAAALAQTQWVPVLRIGKDQIIQGGVTDKGEVVAKPELSAQKRAGRGVESSGGIGADLLNADPVKPAAADTGELTAQWLEYEIRVPGEKPQVIRREIVDVIGPAARAAAEARPFTISDRAKAERALGMLTQTEVSLLPCRLSQQLLFVQWANGVLANRGPIQSLLAASDDIEPAKLETLIGQFQPMLSELHMLAALRDSTANNGYTYYARPVILTQHYAFRPGADDKVIPTKAFDIVANSMGVHRWCPYAPQLEQLSQGVADTNAEALLLTSQRRSGNAADALAVADERGDKTIILRDANAALGEASLPPDAAARVKADLAAGYRVLCLAGAAPNDVASATWWRVNPKTGETLGYNGHGWGATLGEYAMIFMLGFSIGMSGCVMIAQAAGYPMNKNNLLVCLGVAVAVGAAFCFLALAIEGAAEAEAANAARGGAGPGGGGFGPGAGPRGAPPGVGGGGGGGAPGGGGFGGGAGPGGGGGVGGAGPGGGGVGSGAPGGGGYGPGGQWPPGYFENLINSGGSGATGSAASGVGGAAGSFPGFGI